MLAPGDQPIPGFRLHRRIGVGAFAEVWEAFDARGDSVALKFLGNRAASGATVRMEVKVLQKLTDLRHPNIIHLRGVHAAAGSLVLAMERADGNLAELHETYQGEAGIHVPADHAVELLAQAAEGLDFLAAQRLPGVNVASGPLQHCDIKPANLLLLGETVKVADFGLAAATSGLTHRGGGCRGTPPYAAPEQYKGKPSARTDQYALAVTYCELTGGEQVFRAVAFSGGVPTSAPVDFSRLPEHEAQVLARALHPQPASRYPDCRAFLAALQAATATRAAVRR